MKTLPPQLILALLALLFITGCQPIIIPPTATEDASTAVSSEEATPEAPDTSEAPAEEVLPLQFVLPNFLFVELGKHLENQAIVIGEPEGISVDVSQLGSDYSEYLDKLKSMIASGTPPDIFVLYNDLQLAEFDPYLMDVTDYGGNDEDFLNGARESANFDGERYRGFPWLRFLCTKNYYHLVVSNQSDNGDVAAKLAAQLTSAERQIANYQYQLENLQIIRWYPTRGSADSNTTGCTSSIESERHTVQSDYTILSDFPNLKDLNSDRSLEERLIELEATLKTNNQSPTENPFMREDTQFQINRARYIIESEAYIARDYVQKGDDKQCSEIKGEIKLLVPINQLESNEGVLEQGLIVSTLVIGEIAFTDQCTVDTFIINEMRGIYVYSEPGGDNPIFLTVDEAGGVINKFEAGTINGPLVPEDKWVIVSSSGEFEVASPSEPCSWWLYWCVCIEPT